LYQDISAFKHHRPTGGQGEGGPAGEGQDGEEEQQQEEEEQEEEDVTGAEVSWGSILISCGGVLMEAMVVVVDVVVALL
jgi:hypothetical protein